MRAIVLASILACLPLAAEDEATCPLCGKKVARFEDSPQGALHRFQFAIVVRDEALLREATQGLGNPEEFKIHEDDPRRWKIACWVVYECSVDGDQATLTIGEPGNDRREKLPVVRVEGKWKVDLGAGRATAQAVVAQAVLKQLVSTEAVWRQTDSDRNGAQDYWAQDVAGFYYMKDAGGTRSSTWT